MSQIIDLGKLRFTYTGVYNGSTIYEFNDVVSYGGNLYHYKFATSASGVTPTTGTHWNLILSGLSFVGNWSSGTAYKAGEVVRNGAKLYLALQDVAIENNSITSTAYWALIVDGIQYEGAYSAVTTYQKDDVVTFGGSAYIAKSATTGNAPTDTVYWDILVEGAFPSQTGNAGAVLQTDGTSTSWETSPVITGDVTAGGTLYVGPDADDFETTTAELTNAAAVFRFDNGESEDSFAQIAYQNADSTSSTDIIVYMDNGNDSFGWMGMGIAGSQFNDQTYGITGPGDGYIFHNAIDNTYTGNMVFATGAEGSENKLIFAAGGFDSGLTQMEITPGVNVHVEIPTPSTSPTTGAFTVVGGVGVQGDMNLQGDLTIIGNLTFGGGSTTTDNLSVSDPLVFVGNANNADTLDLGLVGEYATSLVTNINASITNKVLVSNTATLTTADPHTYLVGDWVTITDVDSTFNGTYQITVAAGTDFSYAKTAANVTSTAVSPEGTASVTARRKFAGVVRDASDGVLKFFTDATTKPSTSVDFSEAGLVYGDLLINDLTANGEVTVGAALSATGDFAINTNKFTVAAATGNAAVAGTLGVTGLATLNGGITSSGTLTFSGGASFSGTTDVQELREQVVDVTLSSDVGTLDWTAGNIYYIATAPTGAMTFNVTNVPTDNSKIMTINVFVTQGTTGYIPTLFQIGGASQTIRWAGGSAPTPTSSAGKIDIFSFTLQRTSGGSWVVYGSSSLNF
jgi:cytoskeletal protein CcmA (bactofilin family)